ncbi:hypothetical protein [uncultured Devosia sp.]|uniref:hypothetical protein n=1 Tax=uncultured Devosia sp. TaxID=211434 RepID=UPI0035CAAD09
MSEKTALTELANFVGRSSLASPNPKTHRRTVDGISARVLHQRRTVGELLAAVLALSARTRRVVQPPVAIDLDVFAPGGKRALRMTFGTR